MGRAAALNDRQQRPCKFRECSRLGRLREFLCCPRGEAHVGCGGRRPPVVGRGSRAWPGVHCIRKDAGAGAREANQMPAFVSVVEEGSRSSESALWGSLGPGPPLLPRLGLFAGLAGRRRAWGVHSMPPSFSFSMASVMIALWPSGPAETVLSGARCSCAHRQGPACQAASVRGQVQVGHPRLHL